MVDLVPKAKIESSGIVDALLIGTVKAVEERALMGVIGNGTVTSGAIKLVAGGIVQSAIGGKSGKIVGSAFVIDGVEDVVQGLVVPMIYGKKEGNEGTEAGNW
jgi:hypothetical protein